MPLRLPQRRRAESPEPVPFRRRTPPTPQATRLMQVSLGAGLALLVVLGLLFIPRGLQYGGDPPPLIALALSGTDPYVVTVTNVNRAYPLSDYRVEFAANNTSASVTVSIARIDAAGSWDGGNVTFADRDQDGRLSVGDRFSIRPQPGSGWRYELRIFYTPNDAGAQPPCPCVVHPPLTWGA